MTKISYKLRDCKNFDENLRMFVIKFDRCRISRIVRLVFIYT